MDEKLDIYWQCVLATQKANRILGCIKRSVASRSKELILPLCSHETPPGLPRPAVEHRKDMKLLEKIQRRAQK